jgi:hypothetical protein
MLLIIATLLTLFWQNIAIQLLHFLSSCYSFLMHSLQKFFMNHSLRQVIVVVVLPLLTALLPAFLYWIIQRRWLQNYIAVSWCVWLVLVTMIVLKNKAYI